MRLGRVRQSASRVCQLAAAAAASIILSQETQGLNLDERNRGKRLGLVASLDTDNDGKILKVGWQDGFSSRFNTSWLRYNCHCERCIQPLTGQKIVTILDYPNQLTIQSASLEQDGTYIVIQFNEEDDHECVLPVEWLKQHSYSPEDLERNARLRDVKYLGRSIGSFDWEDINESEDCFFEWLDYLNAYGVAIVKKVPLSPDAVTKVGGLIGPITETLYGGSFSVKADPQPINAAYTSVGLDLHLDLAYYESPPGLQLLHCLQFDDVVTGGDSIFQDSFYIAEEFQKRYPELFEVLTRVPATFKKFHFERANPAAYIYQRPHINVNRYNQITAVTWSPQFEGPLFVPEEDVEPYYEAYRQFCIELQAPDKMVSCRLEEGDCVIFNNRRILHGRTQFELNGGTRLLQGCYVNVDDFRSKVQYLHEKRGLGQMAKRVGNQCQL
ncbi:2-(trimethylamino)ethylphosphonate dioxygenase-like [Diadema antillarum]|uniref:2-(trimethylamino)ethylphosphonate dioxygenase-like n=1 Tax=Diadema antillarum TaxID=105358 RepID=UPI003A866471